ncbi:hypothetical protein PO124_22910 [Bacillus licheniformis]|nr:hypothetical protein [Bacillus licheniformis]
MTGHLLGAAGGIEAISPSLPLRKASFLRQSISKRLMKIAIWTMYRIKPAART